MSYSEEEIRADALHAAALLNEGALAGLTLAEYDTLIQTRGGRITDLAGVFADLIENGFGPRRRTSEEQAALYRNWRRESGESVDAEPEFVQVRYDKLAKGTSYWRPILEAGDRDPRFRYVKTNCRIACLDGLVWVHKEDVPPIEPEPEVTPPGFFKTTYGAIANGASYWTESTAAGVSRHMRTKNGNRLTEDYPVWVREPKPEFYQVEYAKLKSGVKYWPYVTSPTNPEGHRVKGTSSYSRGNLMVWVRKEDA